MPRREDWLYRSPFFAFRAVRHLLESHPELGRRLRLRFAGTKPDWFDSMVADAGVADVVQHVGRLTLQESLAFQSTCDALLLTSSKVLGGQDYSIAGKTFEYLSMKRPIVAFVAPGAQKRLLESTGLALLCDPDAPEQGAEHLAKLIDGSWRPSPHEGVLQSFHRRDLTSRLASLLVRSSNPF